MTESVLFRDVRLLEIDGSDGMSARCDVLTAGASISAIGQGLVAPGDAAVIDGGGNLMMPGLVNAHFHSSVNHMKGRLPSLPLELFMLYESPALETLRPTPREVYLRTMLGCIEMLRGGTTTVGDDCFLVPEPSIEAIDAVCQAYLDSGMRAIVALDEPELAETEKLPFLEALAPPDLRAALARRPRHDRRALLAFYDHLIGRWHGAGEGRLRAAVSCSAPQRVTPAYFEALDDLSRRHDLPFFAHMLETRLQRVQGEVQFGGRSLVGYTDDLGLLSERMLVIHAIWVDADDLDRIAHTGARIAHNPNSNLRLGSGIMPFRAIRDRGIEVCLGVDEAIADDAVNMWSVMKTAGIIHNLSGDDHRAWPAAREVLHAATAAGGAALRVDGLGRIVVGAPADLVLVDLSTLPFLPLNDLRRQLVHVELGTSVRLTMVAGRIVCRDGHLTMVDEAALIEEARALFEARMGTLDQAASEVAPLVPLYEAMLAKAQAVDVGMTRCLPGGLG